MFLYRSFWVETPNESGLGVTRVAAGFDTPGVRNVLKVSDLSYADGPVLFFTDQPLASLPKGVEVLVESKDEQLTAATITKLSNALGENLDTTRHKNLSSLLLDLTVLPDAKRTPIQPTKEGRLEVWGAGELVAVQAMIRGGAAELTDDFNRAALGAGWDEDVRYQPLAIEASTYLVTTGGGVEPHIARHLTALSSADHYCQAESIRPDNVGAGGVAVRLDTSEPVGGYGGGIYLFGFDEHRVVEFDHGYGVTTLATTADAALDSDNLGTFYLEANGSTLTYKWDGVTKITTTDATWTALYAGAYVDAHDTNTIRIDNWEAGTLTAAVVATSGPIARRSPSIRAPRGLRNRRTPFVLRGARTAAPPPVSLALTPVTVTVTPIALGLTPGAVTTALSPVSIPVTPIALGVTSAVSLAATPVTIPVTPQALAVAAGAVNVALTPVAVAVTPVALGVTAAASLALTPPTVTVAPQAFGVTSGAVSTALAPVTVPVTAVALGIAAANQLALTPPSIPVTPQALGVTPGAASMALSPVAIPVTPVALGLTAVVSLALTPPAIPVIPQALGVTPGAVSITLTPAVVQVLAVALGVFTPGAASLPLTPVTITITPQTLAMTGAATQALVPVEIPVAVQALALSAAVALALSPPTITVVPQPLGRTAATSLGLSPVTLQVLAQALALTEGDSTRGCVHVTLDGIDVQLELAGITVAIALANTATLTIALEDC